MDRVLTVEQKEWQMPSPQAPEAKIETMATAVSFASIGHVLSDEAAMLGVSAPSFRSPPRIPGVRRSVTRNRDGSVTVAVLLRQRPMTAVIADMIDGLVMTAALVPTDSRTLYDRLWGAAHYWLLTQPSVERPAPQASPLTASPARRPLRAVA